MELATGRFIREKADMLILGPPGVGKSHLVQAIGHQAAKVGFTVLYRSIFDTISELIQAENFGDVPTATSILDRILQKAEIIQITGRSCRLKDRANKNKREEKKNV